MSCSSVWFERKVLLTVEVSHRLLKNVIHPDSEMLFLRKLSTLSLRLLLIARVQKYAPYHP